jgi:hypothetical protein
VHRHRHQAAAIKAIAEAGIFDNAIVADARTVSRDEIRLDRIDLIVAGDIIETSLTLAHC